MRVQISAFRKPFIECRNCTWAWRFYGSSKYPQTSSHVKCPSFRGTTPYHRFANRRNSSKNRYSRQDQKKPPFFERTQDKNIKQKNKGIFFAAQACQPLACILWDSAVPTVGSCYRLHVPLCFWLTLFQTAPTLCPYSAFSALVKAPLLCRQLIDQRQDFLQFFSTAAPNGACGFARQFSIDPPSFVPYKEGGSEKVLPLPTVPILLLGNIALLTQMVPSPNHRETGLWITLSGYGTVD